MCLNAVTSTGVKHFLCMGKTMIQSSKLLTRWKEIFQDFSMQVTFLLSHLCFQSFSPAILTELFDLLIIIFFVPLLLHLQAKGILILSRKMYSFILYFAIVI